ncbi:MAG TPA: GNAT family N-acetyltransferase [Ohtaekwangia sp.]|nr:GNAT family N-acetyltransferase [Ohtaekwangia sp.]
MEIQHRDDGRKGGFYTEENGKILAEMTYVWAGEGKIIIDHTHVDESLKGKNVGKQLVHRAVLFAREKNIKILPLCPFAKAVLEKVAEYGDVVDG